MLAKLLPTPKHQYASQDTEIVKQIEDKTVKKTAQIPPYPNRKNYIPIKPEDFGDGGAFPEIHVVQYPLNMGKPGHQSSALVAVQVDEEGKLQTDMIVKQGSNRNKIVQTQMKDIKEKKAEEDLVVLPSEQEEYETAERTKQALEMLLDGEIKSTKTSTINTNTEAPEPTYIRYTPNPNAPGYNTGAKQRVIKMVEAQVDPMEPPKHKHSKVPRGPGSPPVPVLHSPPRKLTVEDQQAWKIPPCISNWKNQRGFIIPLDKRLAADGRGLQEVTINNKFAMLSEALYISERKAAEDLQVRNQIRKKMAMREKTEREESLREMANRARLERSGMAVPAERDHDNELAARASRFNGDDRENVDAADVDNNSDIDGFEEETEEERIARQQRERLRIERRKERERDLRLENLKGARKNKVDRDGDRDVSEKIALGMLKGTGKLTGESLYDSRLFNQSSGMDAGFGAEDEYNTYSKPLFHRGDATSSGIYRPKKSDDDIYGDADAQLAKLQDTSRFKPDKGFRGAESGSGAGPRDAPVQFEKASDRREDDSPPRRAKRRDYGSDEDSRNGSRSRNSRDDRRDGDSPPRGSSNRSPPRRRGSEKDDPFGIGDIVGSRRDSSDNKRRRRSSS